MRNARDFALTYRHLEHDYCRVVRVCSVLHDGEDDDVLQNLFHGKSGYYAQEDREEARTQRIV